MSKRTKYKRSKPSPVQPSSDKSGEGSYDQGPEDSHLKPQVKKKKLAIDASSYSSQSMSHVGEIEDLDPSTFSPTSPDSGMFSDREESESSDSDSSLKADKSSDASEREGSESLDGDSAEPMANLDSDSSLKEIVSLRKCDLPLPLHRLASQTMAVHLYLM